MVVLVMVTKYAKPSGKQWPVWSIFFYLRQQNLKIFGAHAFTKPKSTKFCSFMYQDAHT